MAATESDFTRTTGSSIRDFNVSCHLTGDRFGGWSVRETLVRPLLLLSRVRYCLDPLLHLVGTGQEGVELSPVEADGEGRNACANGGTTSGTVEEGHNDEDVSVNQAGDRHHVPLCRSGDHLQLTAHDDVEAISVSHLTKKLIPVTCATAFRVRLVHWKCV